MSSGRRRNVAEQLSAFGELLGVEGRGRILVFADGDDRHPVVGHAGRDRLAPGDPRDPVEQQLAHLGLVAAHGELQLGLVGNDVVLGAGLEAADRHHRRIERVLFAADQRLQRDDDARGQDDRILGRLRIRAVAADAPARVMSTLSTLASRIARASARSCRRAGCGVVEGERDIRAWGSGCRGRRRASPWRLRRFPRRAGGSSPASPTIGPSSPRAAGRCRARRSIWVSWPQACITAGLDAVGRACRADLGGKRQAGLLDDRQRIHVGADHQHRARRRSSSRRPRRSCRHARSRSKPSLRISAASLAGVRTSCMLSSGLACRSR